MGVPERLVQGPPVFGRLGNAERVLQETDRTDEVPRGRSLLREDGQLTQGKPAEGLPLPGCKDSFEESADRVVNLVPPPGHDPDEGAVLERLNRLVRTARDG